MPSYHVYFDPASGIASEDLVAQVHSFMKTQVAENFATGWRLLRMTNKASFQQMNDFHLIVDYATEEDIRLAFAVMKRLYKEEPHAPLMNMVTNFRVAFSSDEQGN